MSFRTTGLTLVSASFCILCLLWVAAAASPAIATPWQEIPRPPLADYGSALTAGSTYLFAAWCADNDSCLGLYRTPIAAPGSWESLGMSGVEIRDILAGGENDALVFVAAAADTCIYRSLDGGWHWESGEGGLSTLQGYALGWNGQDPGYLYAVAGETIAAAAYRSSDLGDSWTRICPETDITCLPYFVVPRDGSTLVYRLYGGMYWVYGVTRSTNAGDSWQPIDLGSNDMAGHDVDCRPTDPTSGCALFGSDKICRWEDDDALPEWLGLYMTYGVELPAWAPECAFIAGKDSAGRLQAAWRHWSGSAWIPLSDGFPASPGHGVDWYWWDHYLKAAPGLPRLFYAAHGDGLWMRDVDDVLTGVEDSAPTPLLLGPVRPNPATGPVTFQLESAMARATAWRVFDAAGRCVFRAPAVADRSLVWDGRQADGRAAAAGVYWVRADLPGRSITRSFVICR